MDKLKAYIVKGEFGKEYGDIVFAETPEKARYNSLAYIGGQPYSFCKAKRAPEYDQYVERAEYNYNHTARTIMKSELNSTFDKWEELKVFLQKGIDNLSLPSSQRTTYEFTLKQMAEYEAIEKRFKEG